MLNKQEWQQLLKNAAKGDPDAQVSAAELYAEGYADPSGKIVVRQNSRLACHWYEKAATQGNVEAIDSLAYHLDRGIGCEKNIERAIKLYKIAIAKGSAISAHNLGTLYRDKGNFKRAFDCYILSMQINRSDYSFTVGMCYYYGIGVKQDRSVALRHFRKVSTDKLGNQFQYDRDLANYYLGIAHLTGEGVSKSFIQARKYFEMANADYDNENAAALLHLIGRKISTK